MIVHALLLPLCVGVTYRGRAGSRLGATETTAASPAAAPGESPAPPQNDDAQFAGMTEAERVKAKARMLLDMRYARPMLLSHDERHTD